MKYLISYGIACIDESQGKKELIFTLPDVTTNAQAAQQIVDLCNRSQTLPSSLNETIQAFLDGK